MLFRSRADSLIAGRVGEKHISFRNFSGASPPYPGLLFVRTKSNQKAAQEGDTFDCVPLLGTTPRNDTKGDACPPLESPPASPADCPGTPTNFTCAAGMNPALRQGFRLWRKRLYAGLPARTLAKHVSLQEAGRRSLVDHQL